MPGRAPNIIDRADKLLKDKTGKLKSAMPSCADVILTPPPARELSDPNSSPQRGDSIIPPPQRGGEVRRGGESDVALRDTLPMDAVQSS